MNYENVLRELPSGQSNTAGTGQRPVEVLLADLGDTISGLEKAVEYLLVKVGPALSDQGPVAKVQELHAAQAGSSPLARTLVEFARRLDELTRDIKGAGDRVEL